jgi:microcin C transport system substrate-binding protein
MRRIVFVGLIIMAALLVVTCNGNGGSSSSGGLRGFDEKKVLPLYEKKTGWTHGPKHGDALVGSLKYGPDFKHFDYVNPDAPVGGQITLASRDKFDSFNPFILKGTAAPGVGLLFETLLISSVDEPSSQYGLLAESIEYPEDVIFSFDALTKQGVPLYAQYYADVTSVKKTGDRAVTFYLRPKSNPELTHILGQLSVLPRKYFEKHAFAEPLHEAPLASGPYRVNEFTMGQSIVYERDPNYWGASLPVNKGQNNFQFIKYIIYLDEEAMFLGFKAGEYDFREENAAARWATEYKGQQFDSGEIQKTNIPDDSPKGLQFLAFNTRREVFQDRRVREAISYFFDFEWMSKSFFYGTYQRSRSYFENSVFASYLGGLPSEAEKKLLLPFKDQLPGEVFTQVYEPPKTDGTGNLRENQKKATEILKAAGWEIRDAKLVNAKTGRQMTLEVLIYDTRWERIMAPFVENLKKFGINASYRKIDSAQWVKRVQQFDFDMTNFGIGQSFSPGNEQRDYWSTAAADTGGSRNLSGIKNPAVDSLIESIITAKTFDELKSATRALDRVLLWNFYVIPEWYINYHRVAFKRGLTAPKSETAIFVSTYEGVAITTWWADPALLKNSGK